MVQYRTVEALKESHEILEYCYVRKVSWAISDKDIFDWIKKEISRSAHILDIGSASGACLRLLQEAGYTHLHGVDLDSYLTEIKEEVLESFHKVNLNKESLPYQNQSFDFITSFAVLEHVENAFHFARECARVLKSGGHMLVSLPNIYRINSSVNILRGKYIQGYNSQNDHIMLLTEEIFSKAFGENFEIVRKVYSQGFIKIPFSGRKIKVPNGRLFSFKVCYFLRKK